jgi:xylulokinase
MLEGVAFAIRDSFEVARSLGIEIPRSNICGGGSKSSLWKNILANVLGIPLDTVKTSEGPGYGAAMLAMVGAGVYPPSKDAADAIVQVKEIITPDPTLAMRYDAQYAKFKAIYPAMKELFQKIK